MRFRDQYQKRLKSQEKLNTKKNKDEPVAKPSYLTLQTQQKQLVTY